jgi:hypothetical protein
VLPGRGGTLGRPGRLWTCDRAVRAGRGLEPGVPVDKVQRQGVLAPRVLVRDGDGCESRLSANVTELTPLQDLVTCNRLLTTFAQKDVTFPSTREYKLAAAVMDACEQGDVDSFTQAVYEYDQLTKLDNCKTGILLRIKKGLEMEMDGGLT